MLWLSLHGDTGHVVIDAMYKNEQATKNFNIEYEKLGGRS
jgi:alkyl sulfatase BDS1-like metallo-beta-lactamase superfamily hydrolase